MSKDVFANPQPPSNYIPAKNSDKEIDLTNEDFRKLLMTPSVGGSNKAATLGGTTGSKLNELNSSKKKFADEAVQRRKAKKLHYAGLMKEVKEREAELALKYRDRAKERRETDKDGVVAATPSVTTSTNYQAVAPDFSLNDNADRRLKIIEESKYLGGDLEHTHLVKGLDYALLQKIKAELVKKDAELDEELNERVKNDDEDEDDEDRVITDDEELDTKPSFKPKILTKSSTQAIANVLSKSQNDDTSGLKKQIELAQKKSSSHKTKKLSIDKKQDSDNEDDTTKISFKTKLARNVHRVVFETEPPKSNELFQPHRMAYIVDLTNEEDADVPITSIRSKADCPNSELNSSVTTNDIVINKLTQILSYLRHGKRDAKKNKKKSQIGTTGKTDEFVKTADAGLSIYDDIGDYVPSLGKKDSRRHDDKRSSYREYFDKRDREEETRDQGPSEEAANEFIKNIVKSADRQAERVEKRDEKKGEAKKSGGMEVKFDQDSYSECYPGTRAEDDVNIDSDEEADFSKMDLGSKKGPVNRWDFETNEEYTNYMSTREALPKAAFQFGVKTNDGRKTRNKPGENSKDQKTKLDKEWNQISKLIDKRKSGDMGLLGQKKPKY